MIAVIFEVLPSEHGKGEYLNHAARLRPLLDGIDGFLRPVPARRGATVARAGCTARQRLPDAAARLVVSALKHAGLPAYGR